MVLCWRRYGRAGGCQNTSKIPEARASVSYRWTGFYQWLETRTSSGFWWLIKISVRGESQKICTLKTEYWKILKYQICNRFETSKFEKKDLRNACIHERISEQIYLANAKQRENIYVFELGSKRKWDITRHPRLSSMKMRDRNKTKDTKTKSNRKQRTSLK